MPPHEILKALLSILSYQYFPRFMYKNKNLGLSIATDKQWAYLRN
jgi:hypothetical protein